MSSMALLGRIQTKTSPIAQFGVGNQAIELPMALGGPPTRGLVAEPL